ncbi:acyloxyacyl hydrolase [Terracidiphilus sp.]|uniref:acyloxyacyl hydrolase n=1 Tax=Terracidiphilus sp. TaxID=1964191 RepID=UPI003C246D90
MKPFLKIAMCASALFVAISSHELFAQTTMSNDSSSAAAEITSKSVYCCGLHDDPVKPAESPVAEVSTRRSWEISPFLSYANGLPDNDSADQRQDFRFLMGGVEVGKILTPVVHAGPFSGQFHFAGNIMPLWQAFTPASHEQVYTNCPLTVPLEPSGACTLEVGGGIYHGISITPVIFRWNFLTRSRRIQPWFQAAAGVIYTTHKFPPDFFVPPGTPGGTSVWNFSPQGGIGLRYFTRSRRSIDFGVNAVHISSASLGDKNPGVNASIQVQVGYTFWK